MIADDQIDLPEVKAELETLFAAYEAALTLDDVPALTGFFRASPLSVRYGIGEVLYGLDAIAAFRRGRGGSPPRRLTRVCITTYGPDIGITQAEFARDGEPRRGRQTQTWLRTGDGWRIVSAHVSFESS